MAESLRQSSLSEVVLSLTRLVRPHQWYKQAVMLFGIVFSRNLFDVAAWLDLLVGIVSFTAIASAAYIFNDINDVEEDRRHPQKQHRPLASGQVSPRLAAGLASVLAGIGLVSGYHSGPLFFAVLCVYVVQNLAYSLYLKRLLHVDILVVAMGFVLRAVAGVVAISVFLSPWLIVSTFLLALVLALGKRRHELSVAVEPSETRHVLAKYSEEHVDQLLVVTMSTLLMAYSLYTFSRTDPLMVSTLPFAFFGVFRYHYLVSAEDAAGQPESVFTDTPSVVNLVLWGLITVAILYGSVEIPSGVIG